MCHLTFDNNCLIFTDLNKFYGFIYEGIPNVLNTKIYHIAQNACVHCVVKLDDKTEQEQ